MQGVPHAFYAYPGTEKTCISAFPASLEAAEAPIDAPMHPLQRRIGLYAILGNSIFSIFWGGVVSALPSPSYILILVYYGFVDILMPPSHVSTIIFVNLRNYRYVGTQC